jgi:hypothetical protein
VEFIKVGALYVSTAAVKAVGEEPDGSVLLHYQGGGVERVPGDDADALREWAGAHLVKTPQTTAAVAAREKAEAKQEKADARAEAKAHPPE